MSPRARLPAVEQTKPIPGTKLDFRSPASRNPVAFRRFLVSLLQHLDEGHVVCLSAVVERRFCAVRRWVAFATHPVPCRALGDGSFRWARRKHSAQPMPDSPKPTLPLDGWHERCILHAPFQPLQCFPVG